MSTLKVTTLQDTSAGNPTTTADLVQGRAKGWINLDGTGTAAIRDSFNVAGFTDEGTGDYTITWDTDFANGNYCVMGSAGGQEMAHDGAEVPKRSVAQAAGSVRLLHNNENSDADTVCVMGFGDQ